MRRLLLLACIGILTDIAMAHDSGFENCEVPLTVHSGNVKCMLITIPPIDAIECKIVKFGHLLDTFKNVPTKLRLKLIMTFLCLQDEKCSQAFKCKWGGGIDANGCHFDLLTGGYHCH